jgi:hypothetical protein
MSDGKSHVLGKKLYCSGKLFYMASKFLASKFFLAKQFMPGKWLTLWYGYIQTKKAGVIGPSIQ